MGEWQPIDTAPKDESDVLVFGLHYVGPAPDPFPSFCVGMWSDLDNKWLETNTFETLDWEPTHWMPVPAPPNA